MSRRFTAGPLRPRHILVGLVVLVLLAVLFSGCGVNVPQNTFDAKGQPARSEAQLFLLALWPALIVGIGVLAGLVFIMIRFREKDPNDRPPRQLHGNTRLEIAWTVLPTALLLGLAVPMIATIFYVGKSPAANDFQVKVFGQQWAWQFQYPSIKGPDGNPVTTLGEVHIPVGQQVSFDVTSRDVVHSFWVPKLAGKADAFPGSHHIIWIRADEPGSYSGQCSEFCGFGHATMKMVLHADSPDDFRAWVNEVTAPSATAAPSPSPTGGAQAATPTPSPGAGG